jgi:hypothetical protein
MYDFTSTDNKITKGCIGYIAEEVKDIDENLVSYDQDYSGEKVLTGINWNSITIYLVEELKKMSLQIKALEDKIKILEDNK